MVNDNCLQVKKLGGYLQVFSQFFLKCANQPAFDTIENVLLPKLHFWLPSINGSFSLISEASILFLMLEMRTKSSR